MEVVLKKSSTRQCNATRTPLTFYMEFSNLLQLHRESLSKMRSLPSGRNTVLRQVLAHATLLIILRRHLAHQSDWFILHQICGQDIWLETFTVGFAGQYLLLVSTEGKMKAFCRLKILLFCREICCCFFLIHLTYLTL